MSESLVDENMRADPRYAPYCMRCKGAVRMTRVSEREARCRCGASHVLRDTPEAAEQKPLGVGDEVTWCHVRKTRNTAQMTTRTGKIEAAAGDFALVKSRNGKAQWLAINSLRRAGQKTELTELFDVLRDEHRTNDDINGTHHT